MLSSRVAAILESANELREAIRVHGATPSARAWLVARCVQADLAQPENLASWVVVCPDDEQAADFAADLDVLWSRLIIPETQISISIFPTWEQSPYSPIAPSIRSRLMRLNTLSRLSNRPRIPQIVCLSLASLCQASIPKKFFDLHTIRLKTEDSVESREKLIERLLESGYSRVDPVEDPGTFAVRGDIVDIFPVDATRPLRVELFGDLIERMREFEISSQRAANENVSEYRIPPAREVLINRDTVAKVRERLKTHADDLGISRSIRDPILSSLQDGIYPDHCDAWAPFAYDEVESIWNYLPENTKIVWNDELTCVQEWDQFRDEQLRLSAEAVQSGVIVPSAEKLFPLGKFETSVRQKSAYFLDRIDLSAGQSGAAALQEQPPGPQEEQEIKISGKHRVFVQGNGDLARGTRHSLGELEPKFRLWIEQGFKILAIATTQSQLERIRFLLEERKLPCTARTQSENLLSSTITLGLGSLSEGFRWPAEGLVVITESEILGTKSANRSRRRRDGPSKSASAEWSGLQALSDLSVGDAIVHVDHGIGRYQGLARLDLSGAPSDFLMVEYANKDKLYLPVYRLNVIQKYVGAGESVTLDRLGSQQFAKTKEKVKDAVKKLAIDLVQLYAERKIRPGLRIAPGDSMYREFEAEFPFDETPDQLKAVEDISEDLESGRVMDRLVCGDVGYGKTEVAIRAAFRVVTEGKQVAVLVPTTVLAYQHEQSFRARFKGYPIAIESVSRFRSAKEQKATLESAKTGKLDILIGTHRLLSRDVHFHDLGLIIVDEEHRFGVEHKEKLKTLKTNVHVLTLTATPIPRTLHMALSGLRDISLINTAPVDRLPIRTYVSKYDDEIIRKAVEFELNRGGQVFFVHNRVQSIHEIANRVRELVPTAKITIGHGQMSEKELEEAMVSFYEKRSNVLVCTSIIESGLDLPSANTVVIHRADTFGLAQLYQIRGRVGRSQQRGYAYLLIPAEGAVTEDAKKRLEVIQRFVELGSGFSIASHDLEIRGGGDLLGPQQSGHIAAVGFDLYTELLEEAIHEIQGTKGAGELTEDTSSKREPEIKTPFPAYLSEDYVPDVHQRLSLYRRLSAASQDSELDRLEEELRDRFGNVPPEALNLIWLIRIKQVLKKNGVDALTVGPEKLVLVPGPNSRLNPVKAIALVSGNRDKFQLTPDSKFVAKLSADSLRDLFFSLESLFSKLIDQKQ